MRLHAMISLERLFTSSVIELSPSLISFTTILSKLMMMLMMMINQ